MRKITEKYFKLIPIQDTDMKSKKLENKIWFFGDSFTQMIVLDDQDYIKWRGSKPLSWTELLKNDLGFIDSEVIAIGGISNQEILFNVYEKFKEMKSGDYCIVGGAPPIRTVGFNHFQNKITTYNNDVFFNYNKQYSTNYNLKDKLIDVNDAYHSVPIKESKFPTLINYITEFIDDHADVWHNYWTEKFIDLIHNLHSRNIHGYFWSYKLWDNFTQFPKETDGKFTDTHWSGDGNIEFFEYLKWCIENNKTIITDYQK